MHKMMMVMVVMAATVSGCAWFKSNAATLSADASQLALCELNYIVTNASPTPEGAVVACAGLVLTDAQAFFNAVENTNAGDGGAPTALAAKVRQARLAHGK